MLLISSMLVTVLTALSPNTYEKVKLVLSITVKIQKELTDSNTGWDFRQVMDLIYNKIGVRYHEVHIYRLLHK